MKLKDQRKTSDRKSKSKNEISGTAVEHKVNGITLKQDEHSDIKSKIDILRWGDQHGLSHKRLNPNFTLQLNNLEKFVFSGQLKKLWIC